MADRVDCSAGASAVSECRLRIENLMSETTEDSRIKNLEAIRSRAAASVSNARAVGHALTVSNHRAFDAAAAVGPSRAARGVPEALLVYVELAVKGCRWGAQLFPADAEDSGPQPDPKAAIQLAAAVCEGATEAHSTGQFHLLGAGRLVNLVVASFELVTKALRCPTETAPSQHHGDFEALGKHCRELLSAIFRLALASRHQIGDGSPKDLEAGPSTSLRVVAAAIRAFAELGERFTAELWKLCPAEASPTSPSIVAWKSAVGILNVAWKGIAALLQATEGRPAVAAAVDVPALIAAALGGASQGLKRAARAWPSPAERDDFRRRGVPIVKFFLAIASKMLSFYPLKASAAAAPVAACASAAFGCLVEKDLLGDRPAAEAFGEVVVATAWGLLHGLLQDESLHEIEKVRLVSDVLCGAGDADGRNEVLGAEVALLRSGRAALFLAILRGSSRYAGPVVAELAKQVPWLLDEVSCEGLYVLLPERMYMPAGPAPVEAKSSSWEAQWAWQGLFPWMTQSLRFLALAAAQHPSAWHEFKHALFEQALHPCAVSAELVQDVWRFVVRRGDAALVQDHARSLSALLRHLGSDAKVRRRLARILCGLLSVAPDKVAVDGVYQYFFGVNPFGSSPADAAVVAMLVDEGFPFAPHQRTRLLSCCVAAAGELVDSLKVEAGGCPSKLDAQKHALACLVLLLSNSSGSPDNTQGEILKEVKQIVQCLLSTYTAQEERVAAIFHSRGIIGPTMQLIPHVQHALEPRVLVAFLPRLLRLCQSSPEGSHVRETKQALAEFLANLGEVALPEDENDPATKAVWGLYHLVLRERHWVLMHMGLQSFAHFAQHTSFQTLWPFVPPDAAVVASDGSAAIDDAFMSVLHDFIERESAMAVGSERETEFLRTECALQRRQIEDALGSRER